MKISLLNDSSPAIIHLTGPFRVSDETSFQKQIDEIINSGITEIVINMSGITSINSQGLSILITSQKKTKQNNGDIRISALRPAINELFELTRLHTIFKIYSSDSEAIQSFK